jgi:hypothetical protein
MLSSLPLSLDMAARSGILVATGMYRKDAPRTAQEAAKAFHSRLQQSNPVPAAAAPAQLVPPASTIAATSSGRQRDMPKSLAALPDVQAGKPMGVLKLNEEGLIEELDEALLQQLPPEQVCALHFLPSGHVYLSHYSEWCLAHMHDHDWCISLVTRRILHDNTFDQHVINFSCTLFRVLLVTN